MGRTNIILIVAVLLPLGYLGIYLAERGWGDGDDTKARHAMAIVDALNFRVGIMGPDNLEGDNMEMSRRMQATAYSLGSYDLSG